jgi:DNA recombination protein RmuC
MPSSSALFLIVFVGLLAFGLGWLLASLRQSRRITELSTTLHLERSAAQARAAELSHQFSALSTQALKENNAAFLQLANETFKQLQLQGKHELDQKEKAVEGLVKPIRDALEKTEQQVRLIENDRKQAYGALMQQIEGMRETERLLHGETRNLVQALRRPEVRGQWGQMTLKRLAELAGMVEHCDFVEEVTMQSDEGRKRPDMIVRLPGGREIIVDAKTPLSAYLDAIEAKDDAVRRGFLETHARHVRERVKELASKAYWGQFKSAPDFVVLFIPGDQFLTAALDIDPQLIESALQQQVILTTPTSLVALLRAIAYGWRQEALAANAERIRELGEELYKRLATFGEHLAKVGKGLETAVSGYNQAVGSFESKLLPGARRFTELGVSGPKTVEEPPRIESNVRQISGD